jgi:hypothetical protein
LQVSKSKFSRASRKAQGLRDPCSAVFFDMVNIIHEITYKHGNCGCAIDNVDASNHKNNLVQEEFNQVVKGVLGTGYALMQLQSVLMRVDFADSGRT